LEVRGTRSVHSDNDVRAAAADATLAAAMTDTTVTKGNDLIGVTIPT